MLDAHTIKVSACTQRFHPTWWWLVDQLLLITENSYSVVVPNMQETRVRCYNIQAMCELKPVYGQQLIPLYERLKSAGAAAKTCTLLMQINHLLVKSGGEYLNISQILETGVTMSVLEFNYGSRGT